MLTRICRALVFIFLLTISAKNLPAQVKTKVFTEGIPASMLPAHNIARLITINEPADVIHQTQQEPGRGEFNSGFAVPVPVDIDLLASATLNTNGDAAEYTLAIKAVNALNLSVQFSKFQLSEHAVLSIYNDHELTDSITSAENNEAQLWATRVYQGDKLNFVLRLPQREMGQSILKIGQAGFGFRAMGAEFMGNPGASASCNINVSCLQAQQWEAERNSVALILVGDGSNYCTGTLIMNTCGSNIPYLLTADHCLKGNLLNWVFQFRYWSNNCNSTTPWREDLQFNGCKLRANKAASDFALVELNKVPPASSGLTYSGWNRSNIPAVKTTTLHHPKGDMMKISRDFQPPVAVPWQYGAANHWRAIFEEGIVQYGSSGGPLYDENHRIVGQLHGNQANGCAENGDNNCWCVRQIPAVGEFGRFDVSWDAGGTPATQLSNWLNYAGYEGPMVTNTTAVSDLKNAFLNLTIDGVPAICSGLSSYKLIGAPGGSPIVWTISDPSLVTLTTNGIYATLTKNNSQAHGEVVLTATVNNSCFYNTTVSKIILIGGSYGSSINIMPEGINNCFSMLGIYTLQSIPNASDNSYVTDWEWSYLQESTIFYTNWQPLPGNGPISQFSFLLPDYYTIRLRTTDLCGQEFSTFRTIRVSPFCLDIGIDIDIGILKLSLTPNPVTDNLTAQLKMPEAEAKKNRAGVMRITDKFGTVYHTQKIILGNRNFNINAASLRTGNYFVTIEAGGKRVSKQFVVL